MYVPYRKRICRESEHWTRHGNPTSTSVTSRLCNSLLISFNHLCIVSIYTLVTFNIQLLHLFPMRRNQAAMPIARRRSGRYPMPSPRSSEVRMGRSTIQAASAGRGRGRTRCMPKASLKTDIHDVRLAVVVSSASSPRPRGFIAPSMQVGKKQVNQSLSRSGDLDTVQSPGADQQIAK